MSAFDLLSIPAMAAGVERVFGGTKELITDRRNALDIESIQANECFRTGVQQHENGRDRAFWWVGL